MEDPVQIDPESAEAASLESAAPKESNESPSEPIERNSRDEPDQTQLGERILFDYSNWGCLAYLALLTIVLLATLIQALFMLVGWSDGPKSPVHLWIVPGVLMLTLLIMLGWSRIGKRF